MTDQPYPPLRPQPPVRPRRRQPSTWPMVIGVVLLAVLASVLALVILGGTDETPGAAASQTESASPSASVTATGTAAPTAPPAVDPNAFALDSLVTTTVEALTVRVAPAVTADALERLPADTLAFVIGGPVDADGHRWYQVSGMGLPFASGCVAPEPGELSTCPAFLGWLAAAAEDGTPWLAAATAPECPPAPHTIVSLSERGYTSRLICFDAEPLTMLAWWPELPADGGLGGACPASETEIGWLVCQNINVNVLGAEPSDGGRWLVSIDPASGLQMPTRGQWLEVTGHFDDPAAQRCGEVAEVMARDAGALVFECRLQFVLTAAVPSAGP